METKPHSDRGHPDLTDDEKFWVNRGKDKLEELIKVYLDAEHPNRETVFKFGEIAGKIAGGIQAVAGGNPEPLREYLARLAKRE